MTVSGVSSMMTSTPVGLEGADVPTLAPDDAPLHLVAGSGTAATVLSAVYSAASR